jgi:hypothetical protein
LVLGVLVKAAVRLADPVKAVLALPPKVKVAGPLFTAAPL